MDAHQMFTCQRCYSLVARVNRQGHDEWHDNSERPPVAVPPGSQVITRPEYAIVFDDGEMDLGYLDRQEAIVAMQEYRDDNADSPETIAGMRMMVRSVTSVTGPWEAAPDAP